MRTKKNHENRESCEPATKSNFTTKQLEKGIAYESDPDNYF